MNRRHSQTIPRRSRSSREPRSNRHSLNGIAPSEDNSTRLAHGRTESFHVDENSHRDRSHLEPNRREGSRHRYEGKHQSPLHTGHHEQRQYMYEGAAPDYGRRSGGRTYRYGSRDGVPVQRTEQGTYSHHRPDNAGSHHYNEEPRSRRASVREAYPEYRRGRVSMDDIQLPPVAAAPGYTDRYRDVSTESHGYRREPEEQQSESKHSKNSPRLSKATSMAHKEKQRSSARRVSSVACQADIPKPERAGSANLCQDEAKQQATEAVLDRNGGEKKDQRLSVYVNTNVTQITESAGGVAMLGGSIARGTMTGVQNRDPSGNIDPPDPVMSVKKHAKLCEGPGANGQMHERTL
ncbi:hypothetical protein JX266_005294 [Neoarthrinium moseri]|nr:hypothetical protein JX266_005294 [Neoarthrinium moseri]